MAEVIRMPKMSDTMEEGVIAAWLKKVGDTIQAGDILAEVETDKATMELEAYEEGTLLYTGVQAKETVAINGILAIIGEPEEDIAALLEEIKQPTPEELPATSLPKEAPTTTVQAPITTSPQPIQATVPPQEQATERPQASAITQQQRIFASPLAKKLAHNQGYDLAHIPGTGQGGRIIKRDIENLALEAEPSKSVPQSSFSAMGLEEAYQDKPVSQMRKTIAKRLSASKANAPSFYLTIQVDMDKIVAARPNLNQYAPVKITFNDFIIKAAAAALRQHPDINVAWLGEHIRYNQHIHIGVAMAVEAGLLVPVIKFADHQSLAQLAAAVQSLSHKAYNNKLQAADSVGSTFTISNLGMLGIDSFTAILNPPSACILAVGAIKQVPVVKEGTVLAGHVMHATLTCDHRVVDGAVGANFLKTFKALLEDPLRLLVH